MKRSHVMMKTVFRYMGTVHFQTIKLLAQIYCIIYPSYSGIFTPYYLSHKFHDKAI